MQKERKMKAKALLNAQMSYQFAQNVDLHPQNMYLWCGWEDLWADRSVAVTHSELPI